MKTKLQKKIFVLIIALAIRQVAVAQITLFGNSGSTGTQYVGWNAAQTFPLTIKHEADLPINLQTNTGAGGLAKIRMQISNTTVNAPTGASFEVGRVQIRENPTNPNIQPLSLLHLDNAWPYNTGGHRSWMNVGIPHHI